MRSIRKLGLVLTVAAIVLMALPSHVALAQSATVSASSTINSGASGNASVSISAAEIGAFTLYISCDTSSVLTFDSITALAVEYGTNEDEAKELANRIASVLPNIPIYMSRVGPVVGTHTGPGVLSVSVLEG